MKNYIIEQPAPQEFSALTALWERSVRKTHHFLQEQDLVFYRDKIYHEYLHAVILYCIRGPEKNALGFIGLDNHEISMLFIEPQYFGCGIGVALVDFAIKTKHIDTVAVNAENTAALKFYQKMGFTIVAHQPFDAMGKPYPILTMKLTEKNGS